MATKSKKFSKEDELLLQDFSRGVSTKVKIYLHSSVIANFLVSGYKINAILLVRPK